MNASRILVLAALGVSTVYAQAPAPAGPPKLQVLIITGQNGHDWKGTTPVLKQALEDTGRFEVRVTEEFRGAGPETLAPYDLVVVNYFERYQPQLLWGDRANNALLDFVKAGKGLVLYHFSIAAFNGWTEYEKMSASNWRPGNGHHSARHDFSVDVQGRHAPHHGRIEDAAARPERRVIFQSEISAAFDFGRVGHSISLLSGHGALTRRPMPGTPGCAVRRPNHATLSRVFSVTDICR